MFFKKPHRNFSTDFCATHLKVCLHLQEQRTSWKVIGNDKSKTDPLYYPFSHHCLAWPPSTHNPSYSPRVPLWSQNPLCQHKSSSAFSCSTCHVTLENLQGVFHLASTSRGHHDPKLPAFSGPPVPAKASLGEGWRASLGESWPSVASGRPACQQTVALVFHCRSFIALGQLCSFLGTKSTNWDWRAVAQACRVKPFLFVCTALTAALLSGPQRLWFLTCLTCRALQPDKGLGCTEWWSIFFFLLRGKNCYRGQRLHLEFWSESKATNVKLQGWETILILVYRVPFHTRSIKF
jgi:hypothetical protein